MYSQINKDIAKETTTNLLGYFKNQNNLDPKYFSEQAIYHLRDVKYLIYYLEISILISLGIILICSSMLIKMMSYNEIIKGYKTGSILTILICVLILFLTLFNFQKSFLIFHQIAFTNDQWLFGQSDDLIKLFPIDFFIIFAKKLIINIIATAILILTICQIKISHVKNIFRTWTN